MTLNYCKAEFILENIGFFFFLIALKIVLIGITFRSLGVNFISLPYQNIALMQIHFIPKYLLIIMHILTLKGKFSSGREGALASKFKYDKK